MKKNKNNSNMNFMGMLLFFILIAFVIQFAVLVYDYIIKQTDNKLIIALSILGLIIILSAICTFVDYLRRRITVDKHVKKILDATEEIKRGNFDVKLDILHDYKHYNQYDLIMENINVMAEELKKHEVLKTDFISNVSHEIKTPLAIIQSYASSLQDKNLDEETRIKNAKALTLATKRLSDLIANILKLNKLENQKISVHIDCFNLTESLSQAVLNFEELVESKNISLNCDFDDVVVNSSQTLLDIVWNNLLSNAIKFTEPNGKIDVLLKSSGSSAVVVVSDSGIGISKEVGKKIFEKFYQGDTSHSQEGNGLGLALVKKVIDILGGEISVESQPGKGTAFTIVLKNVINE